MPGFEPCSLTSGAVRNKESARVSVPSLVVPKPGRADGSLDVIWRTDLMATSSFWEGETAQILRIDREAINACLRPGS